MQTYLEIFFIGLFGSIHCIGMCGGFVAMYSLRKPSDRPSFPYHILYNLGRVATYSFLGGVLGYVGSFASTLGSHRGLPGAVLLIAGSVMILMGLNAGGMLGERGFLENPGITKSIFFRRALHGILAGESAWGAFSLGLLLGFLPCGLLYPILLNAAVSGGIFSGMLQPAVFGLGTVPALMSFGFMVTRIKPHLKLVIYRIAAFLIVLLGLRTLLRGLAFNGWIAPSRFW